MATTRSFTSSYAGDAMQAYILKALVGGETWSTAGLSIEENVKYKRTIKRLASADVVQSGTCDFTTNGTITINERSLSPKAIQVNEQLCYADLYPLWDSADMAAGKAQEQLPASVGDAIVTEFVNQVSKEVEEATWQGNSTGSTGTIKDLIDGFEYVQANNSAISVTGATISSSTIIAELNKVVDAIPAAVLQKGRENLVIFVTHAAAMFYEQAMAAQGVNRNSSTNVMDIYGIEIRPVGGLSSNAVMSAGERKNYFLATDLTSDANTVKILDMRELDGSDNIRFKLEASFDVNIGWVEETVYRT